LISKEAEQPIIASDCGQDARNDEIQACIIQSFADNLAISATDIHPTDTFFAYGLDSLVAVTLVDMIGQEFGIEIAPDDLYYYPVIRDFSDYVASKMAIPLQA
jgi:polyketide synthase PksL